MSSSMRTKSSLVFALSIRFKSASMADSGELVLRWASVPGQVYDILWTPSLRAGFRPLVSGILATGTECAYTNQMGEIGAGFFMIQLQD